MSNPFTPGSTQFQDFETLSDLKWHCSKCELQSGQAKTWQVWRQERGVQFDTDEKGNYYKKIMCPKCGTITVHRKLKSLELLTVHQARAGLPAQIAKKVKNLLKHEEAVFLRVLSDNELEVDHKFPQIRWGKNEEDNAKLSDEQLRKKFILLTRANNLLKSRFCERCVKEGIRGCFPGIYFWYEGSEKWNGKDKHDPAGCIGCFWHDPYEWRKKLNKIVNS